MQLTDEQIEALAEKHTGAMYDEDKERNVMRLDIYGFARALLSAGKPAASLPHGWRIRIFDDNAAVVEKDGLGGIVCKSDDESIASAILRELVGDMLAAPVAPAAPLTDERILEIVGASTKHLHDASLIVQVGTEIRALLAAFRQHAPAAVAPMTDERIIEIARKHVFIPKHEEGVTPDELLNFAHAILAARTPTVAADTAAIERDDPRIIAAANRGYKTGLDDGKVLGALAAQNDQFTQSHNMVAQPDEGAENVDDPVLVPRELLGSACYAIDKKRDAPVVLAKLREIAIRGCRRQEV